MLQKKPNNLRKKLYSQILGEKLNHMFKSKLFKAPSVERIPLKNKEEFLKWKQAIKEINQKVDFISNSIKKGDYKKAYEIYKKAGPNEKLVILDDFLYHFEAIFYRLNKKKTREFKKKINSYLKSILNDKFIVDIREKLKKLPIKLELRDKVEIYPRPIYENRTYPFSPYLLEKFKKGMNEKEFELFAKACFTGVMEEGISHHMASGGVKEYGKKKIIYLDIFFSPKETAKETAIHETIHALLKKENDTRNEFLVNFLTYQIMGKKGNIASLGQFLARLSKGMDPFHINLNMALHIHLLPNFWEIVEKTRKIKAPKGAANPEEEYSNQNREIAKFLVENYYAPLGELFLKTFQSESKK